MRGLFIRIKTTAVTSPATARIPNLGWPGRSNFVCEISGAHEFLVYPAVPYDMGSETASPFLLANIALRNIVPEYVQSMASDQYTSYVFADHMTFPHRTVQMRALFSPTFDGKCRLGLSADSRVWREFDGVTYCSVQDALVFKPARVNACLGSKLGDVTCPSTGPLWCGAGSSRVSVKGAAHPGTAVLLAPIGHRIWGGPNTPACAEIKTNFFGGGVRLDVSVGSVDLVFSGHDIVGEDELGARLLHRDVVCDHDSVPPNTLVIGLLGTGYSWTYSRLGSTLSIHEEASTTMLNTWLDVIITNVCLLCYMHFLSDRRKDTNHLLTVVPELIGTVAAALGVYRQLGREGARERVSDIPNATLSCDILLAGVVLALSAHVAALIVEYEITPHSLGAWRKWVRVRAVRNFAYEYSLLGSVYLQVVPGLADTYQAYM